MTTAPPSTRSDTQLEHLATTFADQGFVHVPSLLSTQEATELRTAAVDAVATGAKKDADFGTGIVATTDAWEHHATLRGLALDPRLGVIARRLAGMPLRVWGGEVLVKNPGDNGPTSLHDDEAFALLDSRITLNAWVALVDVPVERGCLTFLPGSHRRGGPERIDPTQLSLSDVAREDADSYLFTYWPQLRWSPRVTVPLRAGDVTFHHRRTAHLAGANTTGEARVSMLITFTDAEATYQPLPGHDPLPYQAGQRLPDERYPLVA